MSAEKKDTFNFHFIKEKIDNRNRESILRSLREIDPDIAEDFVVDGVERIERLFAFLETDYDSWVDSPSQVGPFLTLSKNRIKVLGSISEILDGLPRSLTGLPENSLMRLMFERLNHLYLGDDQGIEWIHETIRERKAAEFLCSDDFCEKTVNWFRSRAGADFGTEEFPRVAMTRIDPQSRYLNSFEGVCQLRGTFGSAIVAEIYSFLSPNPLAKIWGAISEGGARRMYESHNFGDFASSLGAMVEVTNRFGGFPLRSNLEVWTQCWTFQLSLCEHILENSPSPAEAKQALKPFDWLEDTVDYIEGTYLENYILDSAGLARGLETREPAPMVYAGGYDEGWGNSDAARGGYRTRSALRDIIFHLRIKIVRLFNRKKAFFAISGASEEFRSWLSDGHFLCITDKDPGSRKSVVANYFDVRKYPLPGVIGTTVEEYHIDLLEKTKHKSEEEFRKEFYQIKHLKQVLEDGYETGRDTFSQHDFNARLFSVDGDSETIRELRRHAESLDSGGVTDLIVAADLLCPLIHKFLSDILEPENRWPSSSSPWKYYDFEPIGAYKSEMDLDFRRRYWAENALMTMVTHGSTESDMTLSPHSEISSVLHALLAFHRSIDRNYQREIDQATNESAEADSEVVRQLEGLRRSNLLFRNWDYMFSEKGGSFVSGLIASILFHSSANLVLTSIYILGHVTWYPGLDYETRPQVRWRNAYLVDVIKEPNFESSSLFFDHDIERFVEEKKEYEDRTLIWRGPTREHGGHSENLPPVEGIWDDMIHVMSLESDEMCVPIVTAEMVFMNLTRAVECESHVMISSAWRGYQVKQDADGNYPDEYLQFLTSELSGPIITNAMMFARHSLEGGHLCGCVFAYTVLSTLARSNRFWIPNSEGYRSKYDFYPYNSPIYESSDGSMWCEALFREFGIEPDNSPEFKELHEVLIRGEIDSLIQELREFIIESEAGESLIKKINEKSDAFVTRLSNPKRHVDGEEWVFL